MDRDSMWDMEHVLSDTMIRFVNVLVAVNKGMQPVKLWSNKIVQFLTQGSS